MTLFDIDEQESQVFSKTADGLEVFIDYIKR